MLSPLLDGGYFVQHTFSAAGLNFVTVSSVEYSYKVTIVHPDLAVN
ncbi:MAG: hypothetical protein VKL58_05275 [Cyanobacteriota bacterium]|nr:hypothetical protein [Cyanobacteriota bacterium]